MKLFEFYSKTEVTEWNIRETFAQLQWGVLWKIVQTQTESGWTNQVYYVIHTKDVPDRLWIGNWDVRKLT